MLSHRRRLVPSVGVCWSRFCARVSRRSAAGALLALSLVLPFTQAWARPMIRTVKTPLGWLTAPQPRLRAAPSAMRSGTAVPFLRRVAIAGTSSCATPPAVRAPAGAREPQSLPVEKGHVTRARRLASAQRQCVPQPTAPRTALSAGTDGAGRAERDSSASASALPVYLAGIRMSSPAHVLALAHGCWAPLRGVVPGAGGMRARPHAIWHRVFNDEVDAGRFRPFMGVGRRTGGRWGRGCGRFTGILAVRGKGGDGCEGMEDIAGVGGSGSDPAGGSGVRASRVRMCSLRAHVCACERFCTLVCVCAHTHTYARARTHTHTHTQAARQSAGRGNEHTTGTQWWCHVCQTLGVLQVAL